MAPEATTSEGSTVHVLAVDDDPSILRLIQKLLTTSGLEVQTVSSGEAALSVLEHTCPQLVLADVNMPPGMDGVQLCQEIHRRGIDVPVVLLTGAGEYPDRVRGFQAGAVEYILKPFNPVSFAGDIKSLLGLA